MHVKRIPSAGIALAILTGAILLYAGVGPVLALVVTGVWIVSLWLAIPPPQPPAAARVDGMQLTQSGIRDLIEHSGLPVLMIDGERIIIANAAAREEIGAHIVGQDARLSLRHPLAVDLLSRPRGGRATIQGLTGPRSNWEMRRQPIDERYSIVELIDKTSEVDVSRAHTDFVANASHELRTPLASIIGYMETLVDAGDDVPPERAQKFYNTVLQEARRLQALVSDLMSLSRVEAEKHDHPRERIDLVPLVQQSAADAAGMERTERIEFASEKDSFTVLGDGRQLEQLVRNLVDNALKYGRSDSMVTVDLSKGERGTVVLSVRDRGDGIAPEHVPHLTRRFYRTDPSRSRAQGGTGLGLAIVKHIVERHRGRLDIASRLGEGTVVSVRLPVAPKEAAAPPSLAAE